MDPLAMTERKTLIRWVSSMSVMLQIDLTVIQKTSLVLHDLEVDHRSMTTHFPSLGSLRALAASHRRSRLAGSTGSLASAMIDRDLDRVASDLLALSHADTDRLATVAERLEHRIATPVDLDDRRARGLRAPGSRPTPPRARAS
jgi:hypothetical protein